MAPRVKIIESQTPTAQVVAKASAEVSIVDARGRVITLKKPGVLAQFNLVKIMGETAQNSVYMNMILPLIYVSSLDGNPVFQPSNPMQVDALITRLDDDGLNAVLAGVVENFGKRDPEADKEELKK